MRRLNLVLIAGMLCGFLAHAIMGALQLAGADADTLKNVGWVTIGLVCAHIAVTMILMAQTLYARYRSGVGYFKGNGMFWARRISGFAIIIPLIMHLVIFDASGSGAYRLQVFTAGRMISQVLLVAAIALHVFINLRPALISVGVSGHKAIRTDLLVILSVLLLLFAIAFLVYYLRWMAY